MTTSPDNIVALIKARDQAKRRYIEAENEAQAAHVRANEALKALSDARAAITAADAENNLPPGSRP